MTEPHPVRGRLLPRYSLNQSEPEAGWGRESGAEMVVRGTARLRDAALLVDAMSPEALPAGATRQKRILGWLTSMRLSNSPTVVSNVFVGAALAGILQPNHPSVVM